MSTAGGEGPQELRHTRPEILAAAAALASLKGLAQLSMGELASAVGMSKSGLYAHFASKEALQLATIEYGGQVFEAHVLRDSSGGPEGGLSALLERWLAFYERRMFPGACFFIVAAVEFASRAGAVRDALEQHVDQEIAALETAVRGATESGETRRSNDAAQTAFELHAILMNTHALFQLKDDPVVFDQARTAIDNLLG
ncbi:MAG TPA: TetR/AcrR family transcriptional regulator [Solirubrobacteraceae bacterium]|nr:TetR/AcrR family transcriptional regulator [Solirubrobacteraceae bacterium]